MSLRGEPGQTTPSVESPQRSARPSPLMSPNTTREGSVVSLAPASLAEVLSQRVASAKAWRVESAQEITVAAAATRRRRGHLR